MSKMTDFDGFSGVDLMQIERARQIEDLGYDDTNDDAYDGDELVFAAVCYALSILTESMPGWDWIARGIWPWRGRHPDMAIEPAEKIDRLVAAGALIGAEIDRLLREHARQGGAA